MKKGKWKGLDLVRKESTEGSQPPPSGSVRPPSGPRQSGLGRIRTRRVMRGPDGEIVDITQTIPVWLVQLDEINQIFISDSLKSHGYDVEECPRLDQLIAQLQGAQDKPRLIVCEARAVGQQTPFFRKQIIPLLDHQEIPCLITGLANQLQESSFRQWYEGPMLVGGDLDDFVAKVGELIGPGAS